MCPLTKLNGRHCMQLAGDYSSCEKKMNDLMRQCRNSILMHCVFRQNEIVKLQRCSEKLMRCQQGRNLASIKNDFLSSITRVSELISTILNSLCIIFLHVTTDVIETYVADIILQKYSSICFTILSNYVVFHVVVLTCTKRTVFNFALYS